MPTDPQDLQRLTRVTSEVEATTIVTALAAHGIKATATGGYTAGFRAEAPGYVNVVVTHQDLEHAKKVLAELKQAGGEVDWSQVDVGDPE